MKKKKYLFLIICILLLLTGCKEKIYKKIPNEVYINFKDKDNISVYSDISLLNLIDDSNVQIIDAKLDTDFLGEFSYDYYFIYNNKKYISNLKYTVMDEENPRIFGSKNKTVLVNYKGDLCNLVTYADNYDNHPVCSIEGDYNLDEVGVYEIKINVDDFSQNRKTFNMKLNVVASSDPVQTPKVEKTDFKKAYKEYKKEDNLLGIDISKWQGDVDFEKVKAAGAEFVIIRIGVKLNSNEEPNIDSYYLENIKNAKEAGLKVGVYFYSKALSIEEAKDEANWVLNTLGDETLDLPIVFDWEIWNDWNSYYLSLHDLNEIAKSFLNTIEAAGYKGMIYGSKFYLENFWDNTYNNIWLAHYVNKTSFTNYSIWQFSNTGVIDGINGDVDLDIMRVK